MRDVLMVIALVVLLLSITAIAGVWRYAVYGECREHGFSVM